MSVIQVAPRLMVEDVNRTVAFYNEILGFAFTKGVDEATGRPVAGWPAPVRLAYAEVASGDAVLAFQSRSSLAAALPRLSEARIGGSAVIGLRCDDFDAVAARLADAVPFIKAPHQALRGGRELSIEDINGYVLTLFDTP